jgi:hypothetical protein
MWTNHNKNMIKYKKPCTRNCKLKDKWVENNQLNLEVVITCLGCIYFQQKDYFVLKTES